ncbi:hypothetical protein IQ266_19455 [filamentous cyanobacterium LEGE 11480]|uniref:Uncharacterized protein n=1 Tax=Romeriopsis navalis LEGE 11480 TaxID=2777977 RepID=A0A928VS16_9CYAN|nr:hypothetical protein [Romeriopsis navalis]MBE9031916.1 hypothetical protein [Romeriopsis navalis LEGE 11480]
MLINLIHPETIDVIQTEANHGSKKRGNKRSTWRKPKRKRGRRGSKDSRRKRLQWRNTDKEQRLYQQRWMKFSQQPGKKPPVIFTHRSNEMPPRPDISLNQTLNLTER